MAKAKLNTEKIRAVNTAKSTIREERQVQAGEIKLVDIYKTQPKDQKTSDKETRAKDSDLENAKPNADNVPITDEDIDVDASYWVISQDSPVLIAEIPKSGNRWKQANFDKKSFERYFGATCGENGEYRILLKSVNDDGSMNETEIRPSVSVSSQNYRFELEAANGLDYPKGSERPIAIFVKVSCRDFIYMLLMPGNTHYNEVMTFIGKTQAPSVKMRRLEYVARDVFKAIPGLAIWRRLEKEDSE